MLSTTTNASASTFLFHKKHLTLEQKVTYFKHSVKREESLVKWFASVRHNLRSNLKVLVKRYNFAVQVRLQLKWHQEALSWQKSLLDRYSSKLVPVYVSPSLPPHYSAWLCIHSHEGSWTDSGSPYYGGLQFGYNEWHTYGTPYTGADTANLASPLEQMWAAERYYNVSGFYPWPQTAHECGLI
jgi:hypothetical protein